MLAWKAAKEVATMILVASADVGALEFMVEKGRVDEFCFVGQWATFYVTIYKRHAPIHEHRVGIGG